MTTERVPVRVQMWAGDGTKMDIRCWLDELKLNTDAFPIYFDFTTAYAPSDLKSIQLHAHISRTDRPWKFHRGKPVHG